MGDRANAYVVGETGPEHGIYLYTHWDGSSWPGMVREALKSARPRWNDEAYAIRIVISKMFWHLGDGDSGGGIGFSPPDNEHLITVIDFRNQIVAFSHEGSERDEESWFEKRSFADFVASEIVYPAA